jgi:protein-L-isoaspartate(D-aspartate) O-methyltransferase
MTGGLVDGSEIEAARHFYAEEIRFTANLQREEVVQAFARVPREGFLGRPPWRIASPGGTYRTVPGADPCSAYHNVMFAIDERRQLNNGQPSFVGSLIDESGARSGHHAVHIGCGAGYYTAILAELVGEGGSVTAVEVDDDLVVRARANLSPWRQVEVKHADGAVYDPGAADAILVNAGATHPLPLWLDRLLPGAILIVPLTVSYSVHTLGQVLKVTSTPRGLAARFVSPVGIYPCTGARSEELGRKLVASYARGNDALARVRSLRRDEHAEGSGCWLHTSEFCLSMDPLH